MEHDRPRSLPVGPDPFPTLVIKYALLAAYGVAAGVVGVRTIDVVAGDFYGVLWPVLVTAFALTALGGVIRSRLTDRHALEVVGTLALLATLAGYSVSIALRTLIDGQVERLPVGLLPVILSVFPASRLVQIARERRGVR